MVNPTTLGLQTVNGQTVDATQPTLSDPALNDELAKLAYNAFDQCKTPQDVQAITAEIASALAYNGLPMNGPLMDFVNQCAAEAKQQLGAGGTVSINGPQLTDPDLANELQTLATGAFASCTSQGQIAGILRSIATGLTGAGLPTTGPLVDYVMQLAMNANERIAITNPPQNNGGGDGLNNPTFAGLDPQSPADQDSGLWA
jgi:hypothetical protein